MGFSLKVERENLRSIYIPARRAKIERFKQIAVLKWAK